MNLKAMLDTLDAVGEAADLWGLAQKLEAPSEEAVSRRMHELARLGLVEIATEEEVTRITLDGRNVRAVRRLWQITEKGEVLVGRILDMGQPRAYVSLFCGLAEFAERYAGLDLDADAEAFIRAD